MEYTRPIKGAFIARNKWTGLDMAQLSHAKMQRWWYFMQGSHIARLKINDTLLHRLKHISNLSEAGKNSEGPFCRFVFSSIFSENTSKDLQKPNRILTEGPLFGSLKTLTFRIFSEISRFFLGFTDSDSLTALVQDTALHYTLLFRSI